MIKESKATRYTWVCDQCGWKGTPHFQKAIAEYDGHIHVCGLHKEQYSSVSTYRGILGGFNRDCVCGAHYVSETLTPFQCPNEHV